MARVKRGVVAHKRHKKILKLAKGFRGRSSTCFRVAIQKVEKALRYAYRDRRARKRDFRSLWIQRINAAVREHGMKYSTFMQGCKLAGITLNRKMLSEIAINDPTSFKTVVSQAQAALTAKKKAA
ncbi:MAG: 50S ribosomal protein L20 [Bdellovibrionales bacterium]